MRSESRLVGADAARTPLELLEAFEAARAWTDRVFECVAPSALFERPIAERHRLLFYVGHLEAFDRNILGPLIDLGPSPEPGFDELFAFGIDPLDGDLPSDQPSDWPSIERVFAYQGACRRALDEALARALLTPELRERAFALIEHRLMHAETLIYLLHRLPHALKRAPGGRGPELERTAAAAEPVDIPAGSVRLGASRASAEFVWDNECEPLTVSVPAFAIDRLPVTNGRFLAFVEAGGYEARELWKPEHFAWIQNTGRRHPPHWLRDGDGWRLRSLFQDRPLPESWPVYVSHAEASAFARWAGAALPTEAEWQRAARGVPDLTSTGVDVGTIANADRVRWEPTSVDAHPGGQSAYGVLDLFGNGWEWTSTPFAPFPGFSARSYYPGYSANFFDGRHFVLKGGSPHTAKRLLRRSFRNWFQDQYPYVHATFRTVRR